MLYDADPLTLTERGRMEYLQYFCFVRQLSNDDHQRMMMVFETNTIQYDNNSQDQLKLCLTSADLCRSLQLLSLRSNCHLKYKH